MGENRHTPQVDVRAHVVQTAQLSTRVLRLNGVTNHCKYERLKFNGLLTVCASPVLHVREGSAVLKPIPEHRTSRTFSRPVGGAVAADRLDLHVLTHRTVEDALREKHRAGFELEMARHDPQVVCPQK